MNEVKKTENLSNDASEPFSEKRYSSEILRLEEDELSKLDFVNLQEVLPILRKELSLLVKDKGADGTSFTIILESGKSLTVYASKLKHVMKYSISKEDLPNLIEYLYSILPAKINFLKKLPLQSSEVPIYKEIIRQDFNLSIKKAVEIKDLLIQAAENGKRIDDDTFLVTLPAHDDKDELKIFVKVRRFKTQLCYAFLKSDAEKISEYFGLKETFETIHDDEIRCSFSSLKENFKISGMTYNIKLFMRHVSEEIQKQIEDDPEKKVFSLKLLTSKGERVLKIYKRYDTRTGMIYVIKRSDENLIVDMVCHSTTDELNYTKYNPASEMIVKADTLSELGFSSVERLGVKVRAFLRPYLERSNEVEVKLADGTSLTVFYRYSYRNKVIAFPKFQKNRFRLLVEEIKAKESEKAKSVKSKLKISKKIIKKETIYSLLGKLIKDERVEDINPSEKNDIKISGIEFIKLFKLRKHKGIARTLAKNILQQIYDISQREGVKEKLTIKLETASGTRDLPVYLRKDHKTAYFFKERNKKIILEALKYAYLQDKIFPEFNGDKELLATVNTVRKCGFRGAERINVSLRKILSLCMNSKGEGKILLDNNSRFHYFYRTYQGKKIIAFDKSELESFKLFVSLVKAKRISFVNDDELLLDRKGVSKYFLCLRSQISEVYKILLAACSEECKKRPSELYSEITLQNGNASVVLFQRIGKDSHRYWAIKKSDLPLLQRYLNFEEVEINDTSLREEFAISHEQFNKCFLEIDNLSKIKKKGLPDGVFFINYRNSFDEKKTIYFRYEDVEGKRKIFIKKSDLPFLCEYYHFDELEFSKTELAYYFAFVYQDLNYCYKRIDNLCRQVNLLSREGESSFMLLMPDGRIENIRFRYYGRSDERKYVFKRTDMPLLAEYVYWDEFELNNENLIKLFFLNKEERKFISDKLKVLCEENEHISLCGLSSLSLNMPDGLTEVVSFRYVTVSGVKKYYFREKDLLTLKKFFGVDEVKININNISTFFELDADEVQKCMNTLEALTTKLVEDVDYHFTFVPFKSKDGVVKNIYFRYEELGTHINYYFKRSDLKFMSTYLAPYKFPLTVNNLKQFFNISQEEAENTYSIINGLCLDFLTTNYHNQMDVYVNDTDIRKIPYLVKKIGDKQYFLFRTHDLIFLRRHISTFEIALNTHNLQTVFKIPSEEAKNRVVALRDHFLGASSLLKRDVSQINFSMIDGKTIDVFFHKKVTPKNRIYWTFNRDDITNLKFYFGDITKTPEVYCLLPSYMISAGSFTELVDRQFKFFGYFGRDILNTSKYVFDGLFLIKGSKSSIISCSNLGHLSYWTTKKSGSYSLSRDFKFDIAPIRDVQYSASYYYILQDKSIISWNKAESNLIPSDASRLNHSGFPTSFVLLPSIFEKKDLLVSTLYDGTVSFDLRDETGFKHLKSFKVPLITNVKGILPVAPNKFLLFSSSGSIRYFSVDMESDTFQFRKIFEHEEKITSVSNLYGNLFIVADENNVITAYEFDRFNFVIKEKFSFSLSGFSPDKAISSIKLDKAGMDIFLTDLFSCDYLRISYERFAFSKEPFSLS